MEGEPPQNFDDLMLQHLLRRYKLDEGAEPSRKHGLYTRILKAFRLGELGRYMLDDVPRATPPVS